MGQQGNLSSPGNIDSPIAGASVPKLSNFKVIKLLGSGPNFGNVYLRVKNRTSGMHEAAISVLAADLFVYSQLKTSSFLALKKLA